MCTLVIVWDAFDEAPVVVAANRDEALDRPSSPPSARGGTPAVVAPRDERAGGTWIGYNDAGVFVGLSNRWVDGDLVGERSRGLLVADALERGTADDAVRAVEDALAAAEYAPFNLVVADADAAVLLEWDGRLAVTEFDPGVHVVMNAGYDDAFFAVPERPEAAAAQAESAARIREALAPEDGETPDAWLDRAADVVGDHEYGVCVHGAVSERRSDGQQDPEASGAVSERRSDGQPDAEASGAVSERRSDGQPDAEASGAGFGTKSSSLIALGSDGTATYRFADGPPCETPFRPVAATAEEPEGQS